MRPPADTPAALSTYGVVEDVPSAAPATIAVELGEQGAFQTRQFAVFQQARTVGNADQRAGGVKQINQEKTKITLIMLSLKRPLKSICMKVGAMLGISPTTPLKSLKPSRVEMAVIARMVRIIAL